jgi:hypothetical protein
MSATVRPIAGDFCDHPGRIADENQLRSRIIGSTRLSFTGGCRTWAAPPAVITSRA